MQTHSLSQAVIRYETADGLVSAAMEHARQNGWRVAAAVLDPAGHLMAAGRMDGVPAAILEFATDKAYTATLGKSTQAFSQRMGSSASLAMGLSNRRRLCVWEGGEPIFEEGLLIGAIGVSGAAGSEDRACAEASLAKFGFFAGGRI